MKRQLWWIPCVAVLAGLSGGFADAQLTSVAFSENFDGLSVGDSVNERLGFPIVTRVATDTDSEPIPNAWSPTGPAGWTVDNGLDTYLGSPTVGNAGVPGQGVEDYGVDEWEGWSFADKTFWFEKDDQDRSGFTNATGTVAVADPDEYYDLGGPSDEINGGFYNSSLSTPEIPLASGVGYNLSFDSSWRDESFDDDHPIEAFNNLNNQSAEIIAVFNDPANTRISRADWNSNGPVNPGDPAPAGFKDDTPNERIEIPFGLPSGATTVRFEFNIANAGNDWWWAIDNLDVSPIGGGASLWSEDFEGVTLVESVNERRSTVPDSITAPNDDPETTVRPEVYTKTAPVGWSVDNLDTPGLGDDNVGVFEWEGWSFTKPDFWAEVGGSNRDEFTKGTGLVAVADGDEWDDIGDPDSQGELNTLLETPAIGVPALAEGESLAIKFDSSWRPEDAQTAVLMVSLDGESPTEILRWESNRVLDDGGTPDDPSDDTLNPFYKDDDVNETVFLEIDTMGASTAQFSFQYVGTNDWWWAIDNVQVGVVPEPSAGLLLIVGSVVGIVRRRG